MPSRPPSLYLHEEILLLALRDEEGTIASGAWYQSAMGGGILAELVLAERLTVDEGKKPLVNVISDAPLNEAVLDECLTKVVDAKRRASASTWVQRFGNVKDLKHRVALGLCDRGILRADEDAVLLIFKRRIYPEINPAPERRLIERLRKAIFDDPPRVDGRTSILIGLAGACDILRIPFGRKEIKKRKKRIEAVTNGSLVPKATRQAVEAAQAAVFAAVILPAVITPTITS